MASAGLREEAVVVPGEVPLIGTLTRGPASDGPAVVLLNAGLVQRAGPDGLHVRLAASLAARGFRTLRLDYSGVGDTPVRRDRIPIHDARVLETRSALDWLQAEHGVERFVLAGICTGADNAFRTALADDRVAGLILLDGYPYRTRGWWLRHHVPRLLRASSWRTLLRAGSALPEPGRAAAPPEPDVGGEPAGRAAVRRDNRPGWDGVARLIPTRDELAGQLTKLIDRGVHSYFIYTGGYSDWVNYAGQLKAAVRGVSFRDRVTVDYLPGADHVFRPAASQTDLTDRVGAWLVKRWGPQ